MPFARNLDTVLAMIEVPTLTTKRLLLRELRGDDLDAYAAMMADPDVTRYLGDGKPLEREGAWRQMAMFAGHWVLRGFGVWAVEERDSGAFIGRIGCMEPEGYPVFEVAYTLARPFWGRGYAREGAAAALHYARTVLQRDPIHSIIRPANAGSIRVAESLGATPDRMVDFFGAPARLYRYPSVRAPG